MFPEVPDTDWTSTDREGGHPWASMTETGKNKTQKKKDLIADT